MEALFFLIDSVVMVTLVYYGLLDERRPRSAPRRSPFRYFEGGRTTEVVKRELAEAKQKERVQAPGARPAGPGRR